ncbi:SpoIIE family protein phosphatase [Streptomyces adustus]|uniref:SpoIIE family protein phosphatase n=1 Tax=Streptomyces adustus TaxID=1609272 RepID=A0A5N8VRG2_9ACTN|nr:SpoIIE family protein phosphatase [Streptomyces adustus]
MVRPESWPDGRDAPGLSPKDAFEELDDGLLQAVQEAAAAAGALYVLAPDRWTLYLHAQIDLPTGAVPHRSRLVRPSPMPVTDAVKNGCAVELDSSEELASRYPRMALTAPQYCAAAAIPLMGDETAQGAILLFWGPEDYERLTAGQRDRLEAAGRRLGRIVEKAADADATSTARPRPRNLQRSPLHAPTHDENLAAAALAERLPDGFVCLDRDDRITFLNQKAAKFLDSSVSELLGATLWAAMPWLRTAHLEDEVRVATTSRKPTALLVRRPPDVLLRIQLYPDAGGTTMRVELCDELLSTRSSLPGPVEMSPRTGRMHQMLYLATALAEARGVRDIADQVCCQIAPVFEADSVAFFLAEGERLRLIGGTGLDPNMFGDSDTTALSSTGFSSRLITHVLLSVRPHFISSPEEARRIAPGFISSSGSNAWAVLPLLASGTVIGSCVLGYEHPRTFPGNERAALVSLAGLVAHALDRARQYDLEHTLARSLQESLLPHTLPHVAELDLAARYLPATREMDAGGDFYDVLLLDDGTVGAVIGDVQGHNVAAAVLMGQVRTAVHATAGPRPSEVLTRTNKVITDLDPGLFVSCVYAQIDLHKQLLSVASAGHPPPILQTLPGNAEVLDVPPGLLLGIDAAADYPAVTVPFPPESVLGFYTDGLVEKPGVDIAESTAALVSCIAAAEYSDVDHLADVVVQLASPQTDDIAVLLMRSKGWPML